MAKCHLSHFMYISVVHTGVMMLTLAFMNICYDFFLDDLIFENMDIIMRGHVTDAAMKHSPVRAYRLVRPLPPVIPNLLDPQWSHPSVTKEILQLAAKKPLPSEFEPRVRFQDDRFMREYDYLQHDAVCGLCRIARAVGFDALTKSDDSLVEVVAMSHNDLLCRLRLVNE